MLPLLLLLMLGIVEFGWGLAQQIDVNHKARETLRQAIVDAPLSDIQAEACADDMVRGVDIDSVVVNTGVTPGSDISVTVTANVRQLTGLFGAFWGPSPTMSSSVDGRVEQESTNFSDGDDLAPCP